MNTNHSSNLHIKLKNPEDKQEIMWDVHKKENKKKNVGSLTDTSVKATKLSVLT